MAVFGGGVPCARQAEASLRPKSPLLDRAWERDREHEIASVLHNTLRGDAADGPGSPLVDLVGAARDEDGTAATASLSAAAGLRQSSPEAPAAALCDGSAGEARREHSDASPVERSRDDGDSSDVQASAPLSVYGTRDCGYVGSLFEPGDEILVERKLWRADQMPLAERCARRDRNKPHSFVG